jgi:death-on-curing protein
MQYLTTDDLLDLHAYAVERYGGLLGIKSQDRLQQALQAPRQVLFGDELYPDVVSKAAVQTYLLVKSHPFNSANEVTALLALLRLLAINGLRFQDQVEPAELVWVMRALHTSDLDRDGLEVWLRTRVAQAQSEAL